LTELNGFHEKRVNVCTWTEGDLGNETSVSVYLRWLILGAAEPNYGIGRNADYSIVIWDCSRRKCPTICTICGLLIRVQSKNMFK